MAAAASQKTSHNVEIGEDSTAIDCDDYEVLAIGKMEPYDRRNQLPSNINQEEDLATDKLSHNVKDQESVSGNNGNTIDDYEDLAMGKMEPYDKRNQLSSNIYQVQGLATEKLSQNVKDQESLSGNNHNKIEHGGDKPANETLNQSNTDDVRRENNGINKRIIRRYILGIICFFKGTALLVALLWYTQLYSWIEAPLSKIESNATGTVLFTTENNYPQNIRLNSNVSEATTTTHLVQSIIENKYPQDITVYSDLLEATFKYKKRAYAACNQMLLIQDKIWCAGPRESYLRIYSPDSMKGKNVAKSFPRKIYYQGLTYAHTGHIILVCGKKRGLHQMLKNGKYVGRIAKGSFSAICSFDKKLFAVSKSKKTIVVIFKHKSTKWIKFEEIDLKVGNINSLFGNNNYLYVGLQKEIYVYDKKMVVTDVLSESNLKLDLEGTNRFCGVDREESFLLVTIKTGNIFIYKKKEKWHQLHITLDKFYGDKPGKKYVKYAVLDGFNRHLWVATENRIYIFDIIS